MNEKGKHNVPRFLHFLISVAGLAFLGLSYFHSKEASQRIGYQAEELLVEDGRYRGMWDEKIQFFVLGKPSWQSIIFSNETTFNLWVMPHEDDKFERDVLVPFTATCIDCIPIITNLLKNGTYSVEYETKYLKEVYKNLNN